MVRGLRLFWHSLWQLFGNLPAALMISALPAALMVGLLYALNLEFLLVPENLNRALARGLLPCGRLAVFVFAAQAAFCWIAVGWHRFVLMEEPHGRGIPAQANVIGFSMFVIAVLLVVVGQVIGSRRRSPSS